MNRPIVFSPTVRDESKIQWCCKTAFNMTPKEASSFIIKHQPIDKCGNEDSCQQTWRDKECDEVVGGSGELNCRGKK